MKRYRLFKIETVRQTHTRPERIKITDMWWKESIIISYRCDGPSDRKYAAMEFLDKQGIDITADAPTQHEEIYLLSTNFPKRIK